MTQNPPPIGQNPYYDWKFRQRHPFIPQVETLLQAIEHENNQWLELCEPQERAHWDSRFPRWAQKLDAPDAIDRLVKKLRQLQDQNLQKQLESQKDQPQTPPDIPQTPST